MSDTNDTHGEQGEGWYGFDLDGTLAKYDGWKGIDNIGEPVKPMVDLIRRMHEEGKVVKIVTARVAPRKNEDGTIGEQGILMNNEQGIAQHYVASYFIRKWCQNNLGFVPDIVYQKDHLMLELYDDRVKQVVPNEGWLIEDIARSKRQRTETTIVKNVCIDIRWPARINCFMLGALVGVVALGLLTIMLGSDMPEAEKNLHDAVEQYHGAKTRSGLVNLVDWFQSSDRR